MTSYDNSSRLQTGDSAVPPFWVCVLLGLFMIMAGILVLGDVVLVTVISTVILGFAAIATGVFEITREVARGHSAGSAVATRRERCKRSLPML
jgi:uncharacterized membrane protein HdeD (DUF308 family)